MHCCSDSKVITGLRLSRERMLYFGIVDKKKIESVKSVLAVWSQSADKSSYRCMSYNGFKSRQSVSDV